MITEWIKLTDRSSVDSRESDRGWVAASCTKRSWHSKLRRSGRWMNGTCIVDNNQLTGANLIQKGEHWGRGPRDLHEPELLPRTKGIPWAGWREGGPQQHCKDGRRHVGRRYCARRQLLSHVVQAVFQKVGVTWRETCSGRRAGTKNWWHLWQI